MIWHGIYLKRLSEKPLEALYGVWDCALMCECGLCESEEVVCACAHLMPDG